MSSHFQEDTNSLYSILKKLMSSRRKGISFEYLTICIYGKTAERTCVNVPRFVDLHTGNIRLQTVGQSLGTVLIQLYGRINKSPHIFRKKYPLSAANAEAPFVLLIRKITVEAVLFQKFCLQRMGFRTEGYTVRHNGQPAG